jgi:hypothetical protein
VKPEIPAKAFLDVVRARAMRRRFACGCNDWSERRPHIAGAIGAEFLETFLRNGWVTRELDSRALLVTNRGRQALQIRVRCVGGDAASDLIVCRRRRNASRSADVRVRYDTACDIMFDKRGRHERRATARRTPRFAAPVSGSKWRLGA